MFQENINFLYRLVETESAQNEKYFGFEIDEITETIFLMNVMLSHSNKFQ